MSESEKYDRAFLRSMQIQPDLGPSRPAWKTEVDYRRCWQLEYDDHLHTRQELHRITYDRNFWRFAAVAGWVALAVVAWAVMR